ncbi:MAG: hypothetical protein QT05_C0050G0049 [archaeon GW2011_AR13]|nr:MAG: hypothetical protein QT05_C0050G0049 [archaeon GW2011_AR13]MBS3064466.1 hypothetical protein [DPANN group archaeon]HIG95103.1 hypothetical protein [Nanoarchaeota archaeon]HIH63185.1 hypothetical protein [Nanoarchaeota archaeon]HIJ09289.1 hypothetical protein [Nanoarchaeota archaeon]
MKKESVSKKVESPKNERDIQTEKILVENFVALQKVMVNLSIKFDNLSGQISKLLELFEISAKALAEKDFDLEKDTKDKEKILKKLDDLFDQNKVIARGLTLLHEPVQKMEPPSPQQSEPSQMQPPVPSPKIQQLPPVQMIPRDQYQLSISSNPQRFKQLPRG